MPFANNQKMLSVHTKGLFPHDIMKISLFPRKWISCFKALKRYLKGRLSWKNYVISSIRRLLCFRVKFRIGVSRWHKW